MSARPHPTSRPVPEPEPREEPARPPAPAGRRGAGSGLLRAGAAGFLFGGLLYGLPIGLIHLVHNRVHSVGDALAAFGAFLVLYGAWAAAAFALGWAGASALSRFRRRRNLPEHGGLRAPRGILAGMVLFHLVFWEIFWLYGLTYDQAPFGPPSGAGGMLALLIGLGLALAIVVVIGSWALARAGEALRSRGRGWGQPLKLAWGGLAAGLVAFAAVPVVIGAPAPAPSPPPAASLRAAATGLKVVLVGLDGADWRVARPLMARGELPAFSAMVQRGAAADLTTLHDSNSAVIWASIYTGVAPEVHGVLDFYRIHLPGMASAGLFPVHRTFFKELADVLAKVGLAERTTVDRASLSLPPLWEIADRAGLTVGVVDGYFYSFPALKPSAPGSFFLSYGLDAFPPGKPARQVELFAQPKELFRRLRPLLDRGDFGWQSAALSELLAAGPQPRFVNFYTHEPDSSQHWYWKGFEPRRFFGVGADDLEKGKRIPEVYREFDAFLARLASAVEPGTVVVVASDHGHSPTIVHEFYTQHRHGPPGILLMAGGPVLPGRTLSADIYDLYPTILYLLGVPVPADAAGRVLTEALDPAWVRRHPLRTVPSYRGVPPSPGLPFVRGDAERNRQEIEKLKALGYI